MKPSLNYYQSLHVGKVKTDVIQFTTIQSAIDSITDNAAGKRYAIYVHPGTYSEAVVMEDYVDLIAAGGREETIITRTCAAHDQPTVTGENSMIKGFTIVSDGNAGAWRARCVTAATAGFEIEDCILTPQITAVAAVALNASASCDIRDCVVDSASAATTGALFTTAGQTYNVERTKFDAATDAIQVTTTPTLNLTDCTVSDNFNQDGGTVNVQRCQMEATDFGTAACTFSAELTRFTAALATAGAFAHTITCIKCSFSGQNFNNAATGATAIDLRECGGIATLTNAGVAGTLDIWDCGIEIINTSQGTVTALGGRIASCAASTGVGFVWWENSNRLKVIENMKIADALGVAVAGDIIFVEAGTYNESNLTLLASVNIVGVDEGAAIIQSNSPANAILNCAVACTIANLTVHNQNAGAPAVAVTTGTLTIDNCMILGTGAGDAITMVGGAVNLYDSWVPTGDIDLSTSACILSLYNSYLVNDPIDTAGAFAHNIYAVDCDFGSRNINSNATGATTLDMRGCSYVGTVTNAGTGAFTIRDSEIASINLTNAAGSVLVYGGQIRSVTRGAGSVVWWRHDNELCVLPSGTTTDPMIASALTAGGSGDVIKLTKGTFAESNLTMESGLDIIGEGWGLSIIETTDNANPTVAVGNNITCEIHGVKISNLGTGGAIHVEPVANNSALTIEDCWVSNAGASDCVVVSIGGAGNGTLNARRCDFDSDAANSIVVLIQTAGAGLLFFNSWGCQFGLCGGATNAAIEASATVVADVNVTGAVFTATCARALYCTGANHTVDIDDSEWNGADMSLIGGVPVVNLTKCNNIGTTAHSVACTVTLKGCHASEAYTIGAVAGVLNAYRTQFVTFNNNGLGAVAFLECNGTNINNNSTSTMTIKGGHWDTVLQAAAAGTINIYGAVISTEFDCSAAGAINAYNCDVASIDSNGGTITLYEGDLRAITDATGVIVWWEAPHQLRVIASTANMKIMDAADAATAGDTILIGPGTFTEALDLDAAGNACTYKGFGQDRTIITQPTGTTVLVDGITGVVLEDLRINLTAGVNTNAAVKLDSATNASASVTLRNVGITTTWTAGTVYGVWAIDDGAKVGLVLVYDSTITCSGGANSYAVAANTCTTATSLISLYDCIIYGQTYDIYNDRITITTHKCELNGAGWWIQNNASAIGLAMDNENPATVTPVTFAGAAGEFADLTGAELYTCLATVLIGEPVYISAANTVAEATNAVGAPLPAEGIVVYKPAGAAGTECYVKNSGMAYMATPPAVWAAGTNVWLGVAGGQLVVRPTNAMKQVLGVGVDTKRMLINIASVEVITGFLNIPIAWGAGSAPTGTHTDGNSRRAVAIAAALQTVFSQAVAIPEDFLAFSKLYVTLFPTATGTFDWTAYSSVAKSGEDEATDSDTATADGQVEVDDVILDHDISGAADGYTMEEKDIFSVEFIVDVLTTTTAINVLGFRLEYTAQRGA